MGARGPWRLQMRTPTPARGEVPDAWSSVRQIQLQKPNAKVREGDQALAAKDLRPPSKV